MGLTNLPTQLLLAAKEKDKKIKKMIEAFTILVHDIAWWLSFISLGFIALSLGMRFTSFIPVPYFLIKGWPVPAFLLICGGGGLIISALFKFIF